MTDGASPYTPPLAAEVSAVIADKHRREDARNAVLSIREEVVERALDRCYSNYVRRQTVRFATQCARDALARLVALQFFYHPEVPSSIDATWTPDRPPTPRRRDTWSRGAVAVCPDVTAGDHQPIGYGDRQLLHFVKEDLASTRSAESVPGTVCACRYACDCLRTGAKLFEALERQVREEALAAKPAEVAVPAERVSGASSAAEASDASSSRREVSLSLTSSKEKMLWYRAKSKAKAEERIEIPEGGRGDARVGEVELPPIRIRATFQSRPIAKRKGM